MEQIEKTEPLTGVTVAQLHFELRSYRVCSNMMDFPFFGLDEKVGWRFLG